MNHKIDSGLSKVQLLLFLMDASCQELPSAKSKLVH